jgi:hypothetical protein
MVILLKYNVKIYSVNNNKMFIIKTYDFSKFSMGVSLDFN